MLPGTSIIEFPNLKRTRRYGAKVKTGCITCKIRRVRCDERKPFCSRCTSTGRKCDGYAQEQSAQPQALSLPKTSLFRCNGPRLTISDDGVHYLEFYHHCAGRTLSSRFDDGFWSHTVPQMAQSEDSVRHALVALGYLNRTQLGSLKHARSSFATGSQSTTLLVHYNKAVRSLVDRMAEVSYTPEIGLLTCILFVCIEFFRGNYLTAFAHLNGGLKVISEWQQWRAMGSPSDSTLETFSTGSPVRFSSSGNMMEEKLVPLFFRTMTPALMFGAPVEEIFEIPIPQPQTLMNRPFTTIYEAQWFHLRIRNPTLLFCRTMAMKLVLKEQITVKDLQDQAQLLACHHTWFEALRTLERENHLSEEDSVTASALKVGWYTTYTVLACAVDVNQTLFDAHFESFKALIHHAIIVFNSMGLPVSPSAQSSADDSSSTLSDSSDSTLAASSDSSPRAGANFTFEISLIPCVGFAVHRCRCPSTRREALSLLKRKPPREALWDADVFIAISNRIIELEEKTVDPETGWPLESSRIWCSVADGNMDKNGGFWVRFAYADWVLSNTPKDDSARRRADAQWEEYFVV